jgi:monoamine oxidase
MDADVIIIGAGAAGIAAGMRLREAGQRVIILEARDRIGGRIHTDYEFANFPVERGAEFIHGANVVTHELVRQAGLSEIPVDRMGKLRWGSPARPIADLPDDERSLIEGLFKVYASLKDANLPGDVSLSKYFADNGYPQKIAQDIADVLFAQTCCASIYNLSCHDLQREMRVDHSGGLEHGGESRIREGYSALITWMARDLDIRLNTPATHIQRTDQGVRITAKGADYTARACILTIPVAVLNEGLKSGALTFDPPLSDIKREAIAAFRTEGATKLVYQFRQRLWDTDLTYMADDWFAARWWTPAYERDNADAVISAFITATRAIGLYHHIDDAVLKLGLSDLGTMLGISDDDLHAALVKCEVVNWGEDPWALGGYAYVPVGKANARPALAAPESGGLFFAGEATAYDTNPQTVHGAIESGWRAAGETISF